jgi:hypothetical protein
MCDVKKIEIKHSQDKHQKSLQPELDIHPAKADILAKFIEN